MLLQDEHSRVCFGQLWQKEHYFVDRWYAVINKSNDYMNMLPEINPVHLMGSPWEVLLSCVSGKEPIGSVFLKDGLGWACFNLTNYILRCSRLPIGLEANKMQSLVAQYAQQGLIQTPIQALPLKTQSLLLVEKKKQSSVLFIVDILTLKWDLKILQSLCSKHQHKSP